MSDSTTTGPQLDVTEEDVLRHLREEADHPLKPKEIAWELNVSHEEYRLFKDLLDELEEQGLVYRQRKGRYAVPENINLAIGRLQVTRKGDGFVQLGHDEEDVFVPEQHLGTAVDGDEVIARIEKRPEDRNPEGKVIRVRKRAWSQVVGVYHSKRNYGFVSADEPDLDKDVFIPPDAEGEADDGEVVVVEIADWGEDSPSPVGKVVRVLGTPEEAGVDVLSILYGHQLPLEFPDEVEERAREVAEAGVQPDAAEGRVDMRGDLAFTIDPPDAEDFDDALSVQPLEDGTLRVGVHIADVSHYVEEGGVLDEEARERGTSVYLVDRVVPMLPEELSGDLCSLRPSEDRLAFSVLFRMDEEGRVQDRRLERTLIRSRRRLTYDEAQQILDGEKDAPDELEEALHLLKGVSQGIRRRREERGSIDFDLPESRVILNAAGEPTDIERVRRHSTHRLIEDLMIQANETVAEIALDEDLPFVFRVHEEPAEDKIENLRSLSATFGHQLPSGRVEPRDLAKLLDRMEGTPQEDLISTATLRSMKQAHYDTENVGHFGLASDAYSHFTSPIRRYPDLLIHRELGHWLADREREDVAAREDWLQDVAEHCSERERRAVEAERDSVDLKKIEFMERHLGDEFEGTISGVTAFGFFVLLDEYHVEGLVHVSTLEDDYYVFEEERHALKGQRKNRDFQLGDRVAIQVARVDREERQIDFELEGAPDA